MAAEQMTPGTPGGTQAAPKAGATAPDDKKTAPDTKAAERAEEETGSNADLGPVEKAQNQAVAGVKFDHGEKSDAQKALEEAQAEDVKQAGLGGMPAQMHPDNQVDPAEGRNVLVDGLNPHLTEDNPVVGGTLPPV